MADVTLDIIISSLRAAGEPTRLRLLRLLAGNELTVTELTQILGQSQPRVSRHLRLLTEAGLVERFPEGTWAFYRLADRRLFTSSPAPSQVSDNGGLAELIVKVIPEDDVVIARDLARLETIKHARSEAAAVYFRANAQEWDRIRALQLAEDEVESAIIEMVANLPADELIDLGTGTGRLLQVLSAHVNRGIGVDSSREMLAVARSNLEASETNNCHVRHGDIFSLPFSDECADLITVHHVLHFLANPHEAVQEAARLLRRGGHLLIIDFTPHELEFLRSEHAHRRLGFSDAEVQSWFKRAGLLLTNERELSPDRNEAERKLTVKLWLASRPARGAQKSRLDAAQ
jgi:ArsR family transcriptional regulator